MFEEVQNWAKMKNGHFDSRDVWEFIKIKI